MKRWVFFLIFVLILATVSATDSVDDVVNTITKHAEDYEAGKISLAQLSVYKNSVRSDFFEVLGVNEEEFRWGNETQQQIVEKAIQRFFGEPFEKTNWAWNINEDREEKLDESVPAWRKIIFDGKKVQITFNAWPEILYKKGKKQIFYWPGFEVRFKQQFDFDIDKLISSIKETATIYSTQGQKSDLLIDQIISTENLLNNYLQQNRFNCISAMETIFDKTEKAQKESLTKWRVYPYSGEDFDLWLELNTCNSCEWPWINFWIEVESHRMFRGKQDMDMEKIDKEELKHLSIDELYEKQEKLIDELVKEAEKLDRTGHSRLFEILPRNRHMIETISWAMDEIFYDRKEPEERQIIYEERIERLEEMFSEYGKIEKTPVTNNRYEKRLVENLEENQHSWCQHVNDIPCGADEGCVNGECIYAKGGEEDCRNNMDDDGDNVVDCNDPDCFEHKDCGKMCEPICNKPGGCWQTNDKLCRPVCEDCWGCYESGKSNEECDAICQEKCWPCSDSDEIKQACNDCWNCEDEAYGGCRKVCEPCNECSKKDGEDCSGECKECSLCNYENGDFQCNENQVFSEEEAYCMCEEGFYDCDENWNNGCESDFHCGVKRGKCKPECNVYYDCMDDCKDAIKESCDKHCEGVTEFDSCHDICMDTTEEKTDCRGICFKGASQHCQVCKKAKPRKQTQLEKCIKLCSGDVECKKACELEDRNRCLVGCGDDEDCKVACIGKEGVYFCDGKKQRVPCEDEYTYICNGVKSYKPCKLNYYVCNGKRQDTPCEGITECEMYQYYNEDEKSCRCIPGHYDCDGDGDCDYTQKCKGDMEVCDDNKDNDGDFMVDCNDMLDCSDGTACGDNKYCNNGECIEGQFCMLYCGTCSELDYQGCQCKVIENCCGNGICEEDETCPEDCEFQCMSDSDCEQPKCGYSECIESECLTVVQECKICEDGETKTEQCGKDIIVTEKCEKNQWTKTGEECITCSDGEAKEAICLDGSMIAVEICKDGQWIAQEIECPIVECIDGETQTTDCPDDSVIITAECVENTWILTENECGQECHEEEIIEKTCKDELSIIVATCVDNQWVETNNKCLDDYGVVCEDEETRQKECPDDSIIEVEKCENNAWVRLDTQCPEVGVVCEEGEKQEEQCPDGSTILTATCSNNEWHYTLVACPIEEETECKLVSDCGQDEVCSNGECVYIEPVEEEEEEIIPLPPGIEEEEEEEEPEQEQQPEPEIEEEEEIIEEPQPEVEESEPEEQEVEEEETQEQEPEPQEEEEPEPVVEEEPEPTPEPEPEQQNTEPEITGNAITAYVVATGMATANKECRDDNHCDQNQFCWRESTWGHEDHQGICAPEGCSSDEDCPDPKTQHCWDNGCHCNRYDKHFDCDKDYSNGCESTDVTCGGTVDACAVQECDKPNQWCNPERGDCECKEGFYECNGDWEDGCESTSECDGCKSSDECAKPRCAEHDNILYEFACVKSEPWVEERGMFMFTGGCEESSTETWPHVHFNFWGEPFDQLRPKYEQKRHQNEQDWCEREFELFKKQRKEIEKSINEEFMNWFFNIYVRKDSEKWTSHIGGIFDTYWMIVDNTREVVRTLQCMGEDEWPKEFEPINIEFESDFGYVKLWEEEKHIKEFDKIDTILSPYMQIWIFPPKDLFRFEIEKAYKLKKFPGPPDEEGPGPTPEEIEEIRNNPVIREEFRKILDEFDGSIKVLLQIEDNDEIIYKALATLDDEVIFDLKVGEDITLTEDETDITMTIDLEWLYEMVSTSEKDMRGEELESPPWDRKPRMGAFKQMAGNIKMGSKFVGGLTTGKVKVKPMGKAFKLMGFFRDMDELRPEDERDRRGEGGEEERGGKRDEQDKGEEKERKR